MVARKIADFDPFKNVNKRCFLDPYYFFMGSIIVYFFLLRTSSTLKPTYKLTFYLVEVSFSLFVRHSAPRNWLRTIW